MLTTTLEELQVLTTARTGPGTFEYRGFLIKWTGYKPAMDTSRLSGQWLAMSLHKISSVPPDLHPYTAGPFFYADIGGRGGEYRKGQTFDISGSLFLESPVEEVIAAAMNAKLRLLAMVDECLGEYRGSPDGRKQ